MRPEDLTRWTPLWEDLPINEVEVAVKVMHKNGTFGHDIGKLYAEGGWQIQAHPQATVVAWCPLPRS